MRVAFDTRVLGDPATAERGVGRYTACLLDALRALGAGDVVPLRVRRRPRVPAGVAEALEHRLLEQDVRRSGADVVHSPSIDWASMRTGVPLVVTVHDVLPLKDPDRYLNWGVVHSFRYAAVLRAARVIVPSQHVASDVDRYLPLPSERVVVVPEAAPPSFAPVPEPRSRLGQLELPERFLLWVGGLDPLDPRKGVAELAAAVSASDGLPLVLAGRADDEARALAAPGRVLLAGRLPDDELAALYSAADALVFPSEDEGFGLPPLEALACGTPVAAYAAGPLPETLAEASGVELVEPGDLAALLEAAERLAGARVSAPQRSWKDVARETWQTYEAAYRVGPVD